MNSDFVDINDIEPWTLLDTQRYSNEELLDTAILALEQLDYKKYRDIELFNKNIKKIIKKLKKWRQKLCQKK